MKKFKSVTLSVLILTLLAVIIPTTSFAAGTKTITVPSACKTTPVSKSVAYGCLGIIITDGNASIAYDIINNYLCKDYATDANCQNLVKVALQGLAYSGMGMGVDEVSNSISLGLNEYKRCNPTSGAPPSDCTVPTVIVDSSTENAPDYNDPNCANDLLTCGQYGVDGGKDIKTLLPMYRYTNFTFPYGGSCHFGINVIKDVTTCLESLSALFFRSFIGMQFTIAGGNWNITGGIINTAVTNDVLNKMASQVDNQFLAIANALDGFLPGSQGGSSFLFIFVFIFAFILILLRNNFKNRDQIPMIRLVATMLLPIAVLQSMAMAVSGSNYTTSKDGTIVNDVKVYDFSTTNNNGVKSTPGTTDATVSTGCNCIVGTPAWIAINISNFLSSLVSGVASSPSMISFLSDTNKLMGNKSTDNISCGKYYQVLYNAYEKKAGLEVNNGTPSLKTTFDARFNIELLSLLWQKSFYESWTRAGFGQSDASVNAVCHFSETQNSISPVEQSLIARIAYNDKNITPATFDKTVNEEAFNTGAIWYAWSACTGTEGNLIKVTSDWAAFADSYNQDTYFSSDKNRVSFCNNLLHKGVTDQINTFKFVDVNKVDSAAQISNVEASILPHTVGNAGAIGKIADEINSYLLTDPASKETLAFISMLISFCVLLLIGGLALGVLIAEVGLIVLLMWLPATLFALSVPNTRNGGGFGKVGKKLLLLTVGFMGSKVILELALLVIVTFATIIVSVLG